ncbi:MAG: sulfatase-like hydrolase/transferase [Asgard group archaeon]|nr:sulfatase-like hydrolase/transferase [Asgard group archaeon]
MHRKKINLILVWFLILTTLQLSFGLVSVTKQFSLNNTLNIKDDVLTIDLIDTPESITDRILILFVDGMRYDKMLEANTPNMNKIMTNGTTFSNYHPVLPSYSLVNYAAFSSGSSTNITNVFANAHNEPLDIPTLYSILKNSPLNTSIITGSGGWETYLGTDADQTIQVHAEYHALNEGEKVMEGVYATLRGNFSDVQFIGFEDVDACGHIFGAASDEYIETIETIDGFIGEILDIYSSQNWLENATIVLFSDHGHEDKGGHGGENYNENHASLVLAGKGITFQNIISDKFIKINSVTPTLLAMLGLPLAPTMNGPILYDFISTTTKTKAIYSIQDAQIMNQQFNVSIGKLKFISKTAKANYYSLASEINDNITLAKAAYTTIDYLEAYSIANDAELTVRRALSALYFQFKSISQLARILTIIGSFTLIGAILFYLHQRRIIDVRQNEIFNKELILPQIAGAISAFLIGVIIFASTGSNFSGTTFNSVPDAVIPNILSFALGSLLAIFVPWLVAFLMLRKKHSGYNSFKDWKRTFLSSTIGAIFTLSLAVGGYIFYYISQYGPYPNWEIPKLADVYAQMIIGVLTCLLYFVAIGLLIAFEVRRLIDKKKVIIS